MVAMPAAASETGVNNDLHFQRVHSCQWQELFGKFRL